MKICRKKRGGNWPTRRYQLLRDDFNGAGLGIVIVLHPARRRRKLRQRSFGDQFVEVGGEAALFGIKSFESLIEANRAERFRGGLLRLIQRIDVISGRS